jgi:hypothetical protein
MPWNKAGGRYYSKRIDTTAATMRGADTKVKDKR